MSFIIALSVISRIERVRRELAAREHLAHLVDDLGVLQLARRQVDGHVARAGSSGYSLLSSAANRQASRSTQWPIGTISPVSSASGMKSSGARRARASGGASGCRASKPQMSPLESSIIGW